MKTYKSTIRIPTEKYAYIEIDFTGTPEEIVDVKNEFTYLTKSGEGLQVKEFNEALDKYLNEGFMNSEIYMGMSKEQQYIIQSVKKSFNRINGLQKPTK